MREIKFKAWHKEYKKMLTVYVIHQGTYSKGFVKNCEGYTHPNDQYYFRFDEAEWMQCTGHKDINGKEIYEGDIVKSESDYIGEVGFKNGCFMWRDTPLCYDPLNDWEIILTENWAEVIGNIYENPELLTK